MTTAPGVDPGNLPCLGRIGLMPELNGIDVVLARLFAGEPAGAADIRRMGMAGC